MEQWRMATISFNLWGEMSPIKDLPASKQSTSSLDDEKQKKTETGGGGGESEKITDRPSTPKRTIGQAEIESSYFKVKSLHILLMFSFP
jgi:hypothetical protein